MRLLKIFREFKQFDGGVLKFRDHHHRKTYYFELDYKGFYPLFKRVMLPFFKERFVLLCSDGNHLVFDTLKECQQSLGTYAVESGHLFKENDKTYGICNRELFIHLCDLMQCPEKSLPNKEMTINIAPSLSEYIKDIEQSNSSSGFTFKKNTENNPHRFDWAEAYEEGLRVFDGDEDEAEAYADEREKIGTYYE